MNYSVTKDFTTSYGRYKKKRLDGNYNTELVSESETAMSILFSFLFLTG